MKFLLLTVVSILGTCFGANVIKTCPDGWSLLDKSSQCFQLISTKLSWAVARDACKTTNHSHLAYVPDAQTSTFLTSLIAKTPAQYWIGLTDATHENQFNWVHGKQITDTSFKNWAPTEPNNQNGNEHCVEALTNGKWNDLNCENKIGYICQVRARITRPPIIVTCPSGWAVNKRHRTCFRLFTQHKSWDNARQYCQNLKGDLAIIYDKDTSSVFAGFGKALKASFWVGLNDQVQEGNFHWLESPRKLGYQNWAKNEENRISHNEDCVRVLQDGTWDDANCQNALAFACQTKGTVSH